jgi:hypothetical protein
LEVLGSLEAQAPSRGLSDYLGDLLQVQSSKLLCSSSPLQEFLRGGDEHTGEEALVFREDLVQYAENSPLGIAYLVNEFHAEAGQVPQRLDVRAGNIPRAYPADAQEVSDNPGIPLVVFDFADSGTPIGMDLEGIDCYHAKAFLEKVLIKRQPVVSRSLQGDDAELGLSSKQLHQGCHALSGMLEAKEAAYLASLCVQQTNLVGTFSHINTYRVHEVPPNIELCGGAFPDSMRGTYSLVCDAWPNHNLLICSPSQERGSILSGEAFPSRGLNAAPASYANQFILRSIGFQY